jgi:hypothetical protein
MFHTTMDLLADLASNDILCTEIATLRSTIHTLNEECVQSREHCQRLEEEASLQLCVERYKDETDEEFKKRKQIIYNKRSYKKKIGSSKEENSLLVTELETLGGELIVCQEKCHRLSEVGNLQLLERLPGESDVLFAKRRATTYNQRSYQKRKKQMKVKKGVPEPRHPSSVASLPADNPTMQGLDIIINRYINNHPKNWPSIFQKSQDIRLLNVSHWINESGLIKESNPKRAAVTLSPATKILPSSEIKRHFAVQFLDPKLKEWCDLFIIKPSNLLSPRGPSRQNAGYGLFSARPFKCGDRIAVYIGEVFELDQLPAKKRTCYSLAFDINKTATPLKKRRACTGEFFISDCGYPPKESTDNMKRPPVYFGIHYVNDPKWHPDGIQERKRVTRRRNYPGYNMQIGTDLVATTIKDIEEGEELFWDYTAGTGTMHDL